MPFPSQGVSFEPFDTSRQRNDSILNDSILEDKEKNQEKDQEKDLEKDLEKDQETISHLEKGLENEQESHLPNNLRHSSSSTSSSTSSSSSSSSPSSSSNESQLEQQRFIPEEYDREYHIPEEYDREYHIQEEYDRDNPVLPVLPVHILILVHGNNGTPNDFLLLEEYLQKLFSHSALTLRSSSNHKCTHDGIENGGINLAKEIISKISEYAIPSTPTSHKMTLIGHSLGGLYIRHCIKTLRQAFHEHRSDLKIEFIGMMTLCTPHLGSRRPGGTRLKQLWRYGVHKVLSLERVYGQTGLDLLLVQDESSSSSDESKSPDFDYDDCEEPSKSILEIMSDPSSQYFKALDVFKYRTLVAMTEGDILVPFASASIRNFNPYECDESPFMKSKEWNWKVGHSGFEEETAQLFSNSLLKNANPYIGTKIEYCDRYETLYGYECDNRQEVEFPWQMIDNLQKLHWRRVDIRVNAASYKGKIKLHDWPIGKNQQPDSKAHEFVLLLAKLIAKDHGLHIKA